MVREEIKDREKNRGLQSIKTHRYKKKILKKERIHQEKNWKEKAKIYSREKAFKEQENWKEGLKEEIEKKHKILREERRKRNRKEGNRKSERQRNINYAHWEMTKISK